jgi:nicotinamide riboside kinase
VFPKTIPSLRESLVDHGIMVVLEGTHSTGKSSLGRKLAEALDLHFSDEIARRVLAQHNTTAAYEGLSEDEIVDIQAEIMQQHMAVLNAYHGTAAIIDRGPCSVNAYSLAKLSESRSRHVQGLLLDFKRCVHHESFRPRVIHLLFPPSFPMTRDGVREPQEAKRDMVHFLIQGMLQDYNYHYITLRETRAEEKLHEAYAAVASSIGRALHRNNGRV